MKKMTEQDKKQTNGGIAPMLLWVIISGICMGINAITNTATTIASSTHSHESNQPHKKKSQYYASKHNSGYIRMSPFPSRSAVSMPM
jgi:hypothetical protein